MFEVWLHKARLQASMVIVVWTICTQLTNRWVWVIQVICKGGIVVLIIDSKLSIIIKWPKVVIASLTWDIRIQVQWEAKARYRHSSIRLSSSVRAQ